jgi:hypothetical protein
MCRSSVVMAFVQSTLKKFFAYQIEEDVMRQLVEQVFSTLHRLKERRADLKAGSASVTAGACPPQPRSGFESPKLRSIKALESGSGSGNGTGGGGNTGATSSALLRSHERSSGLGSKGSPG